MSPSSAIHSESASDIAMFRPGAKRWREDELQTCSLLRVFHLAREQQKPRKSGTIWSFCSLPACPSEGSGQDQPTECDAVRWWAVCHTHHEEDSVNGQGLAPPVRSSARALTHGAGTRA